MTKIHKDMAIAEILDLYPDSVDIMLEVGLQCVGCSANTEESLEEGMLGHGFDMEEVESLVEALNRMFVDEEEEEKGKKDKVGPMENDFEIEEITEGNKKYYKLAGLMFSQKAFDALHELKPDGKKGLRVRIEAGGCSGYKNKYDFTEGPAEDEQSFRLSDDLLIFMNDFSFGKLHGSIVDYQSGLHGSGLTFTNPNVKGSCSCGTSVAFN